MIFTNKRKYVQQIKKLPLSPKQKLLALLALFAQERKQSKRKLYIKRIRRGNISRNRVAAKDEIDALPDYVFRSMFRVDRVLFRKIMNDISQYMPVIDEVAANKSIKFNTLGQKITNEIKLLATLRFLAGGMKWDICMYLKKVFGFFFQIMTRVLFGPL
jgi:hypothetical protein